MTDFDEAAKSLFCYNLYELTQQHWSWLRYMRSASSQFARDATTPRLLYSSEIETSLPSNLKGQRASKAACGKVEIPSNDGCRLYQPSLRSERKGTVPLALG